MIRCPACRAENTAAPLCRRCRADLSLLFELEARRGHALAAAARHAGQGDGASVARLACQAHWLRRGEDSRRLVAIGQLLQGDYAGASQVYRAPI